VKKRGLTPFLQQRERDVVEQANLVDEHTVWPAVQRHEVARVSQRELAPDAVVCRKRIMSNPSPSKFQTSSVHATAPHDSMKALRPATNAP